MKNTKKGLAIVVLTMALSLSACSKKASEEPAVSADPQATAAAKKPMTLARTESPAGARVFFITPADGATVSNPIGIEFGIAGMDVVKAGENLPNSGHHHLLIDSELPDMALPIPADAMHIHFGDGSTATEITLAPGTHTLRLLLGDHLHIPHDPPIVSDPITVKVE